MNGTVITALLSVGDEPAGKTLANSSDENEAPASSLSGDLVAEVRKLKEEPGGDLLIYGSGSVVDQLIAAGSSTSPG